MGKHRKSVDKDFFLMHTRTNFIKTLIVKTFFTQHKKQTFRTSEIIFVVDDVNDEKKFGRQIEAKSSSLKKGKNKRRPKVSNIFFFFVTEGVKTHFRGLSTRERKRGRKINK